MGYIIKKLSICDKYMVIRSFASPVLTYLLYLEIRIGLKQEMISYKRLSSRDNSLLPKDFRCGYICVHFSIV